MVSPNKDDVTLILIQAQSLKQPSLQCGPQAVNLIQEPKRWTVSSKAPKDLLVSSFYWRLEPECEILVFVWPFGSLSSALPAQRKPPRAKELATEAPGFCKSGLHMA